MFFTWLLKKPGRKCGLSEDFFWFVGAAAGAVVREGSRQHVWCYKLNAEATAIAELGKGWEIIMHLYSRESRFLFFFQSSCCRRWVQREGRLWWELTWFRPITALRGPITEGQDRALLAHGWHWGAEPSTHRALHVFLHYPSGHFHLCLGPETCKWQRVSKGWLIFQWFIFATSSSEI